MKTQPNDPAFPLAEYGRKCLSKREYLAVHLLSKITATGTTAEEHMKLLAQQAVKLADALIEALNESAAAETFQ